MKEKQKKMKQEKPTVCNNETHLTEKERKQMKDDILRTQMRIIEFQHRTAFDKFCR